MKSFKFLVFLFFVLLLSSCAILREPSVSWRGSIDGYLYVYIPSTTEHVSSYGDVFGSNYGVFGMSSSKSVNPADIISGYLMKKGFQRVHDIDPLSANKTIIVNYGESGRRNTGLGGYTIEVTIQLVSADTKQVLCVGTAEGQGETEADDIRIAINRCLDAMFQ